MDQEAKTGIKLGILAALIIISVGFFLWFNINKERKEQYVAPAPKTQQNPVTPQEDLSQITISAAESTTTVESQ